MSRMTLGQKAQRFTILAVAILLTAACSSPRTEIPTYSSMQIDPARQALALREVAIKHAKGHRVWCVPFARDTSGVNIRGNANTWWGQAEGIYDRGAKPLVGAVMTFKRSSRLTMGHVAVVSEIISPREIRVNHANWKRNKVSMGMDVIDVSEKNDWSAVKLKSQPNAFGSVYPIKGFIYAPDQVAQN